jgi:hypothetical protein
MDTRVEMKDVSVMIGIPTTRDLPPQTVLDLIASMARCSKLQVPVEIGLVIGCGVVQWARDEVLDQFLRSDKNRLFWIDSDMTWTPDQFVRLLALSTMHPVVGATYTAKLEQPTFYVHFDKERGMVTDGHGLVDVTGMGLGFTVMRREVLETLADKAPKVIDQIGKRELASVFRIDTDAERHRRGEDIAFFHDIAAAGFQIKMDTETSLGHIGVKTYRGSIKDALFKE